MKAGGDVTAIVNPHPLRAIAAHVREEMQTATMIVIRMNDD
jgi:hypothetical protein